MDEAPANPMEQARRLSAPVRQKRFYLRAEMTPEEGGFSLRLDGRRAKTPGRRPLTVPDAPLAEAIAAEWQRQRDVIDPSDMPATRLANTAIDGVAPHLAEVREAICAYAATDLLYYRAREPKGLAERQQQFWDPILDWAEKHYGVRFVLAKDVTHVAQPEATLAALARAIADFDRPLRLAALHLATTLTGSALIALALAAGATDAEEAWRAAHVDEDWNIEKWGEDPEASNRRRSRLADFRAAACALGR
jgi:chaperone required for assembly of F1-ATPase